MARNEIVPQYYNLFDNTKGYTELLFRAGKVLQSKELNEMQSILKNQIKNVGNTVLTNGDIIEGCQLILSDDRHTAILTKGRIYLDGDVRDVPDTTINITGSGVEVIGVKLDSIVITADEDTDLNDIATGYDNYNQDGAYRLKETVQITLNDDNAAILYTITNGELLSAVVTEDLTQLDKINATLARRTFEESGNYKVSGLTISDKHQSDNDYIYVTLEAGKAYVRGYEVSKDTDYTVRLDRAADLRSIENEPKIYRTGTDRYVLNNNYINSVKQVVGIIQVTQNITRGSIIGGIDYLPLSSTVEILSITQGDTSYVNGVDFQLINDGIDWSIGSNAPQSGSSYTCVWTYNKKLIQNIDYRLEYSEDYSNGYIQFLSGEGVDTPVSGTQFTVNYDFKLCRWNVIALDKTGSVLVIKGQSDVARIVSIPTTDDNHILALGAVLLTPMNNEVRIVNNNTKTIRMLDLYNMLERINDLEYNQAISDLDQEAADGEDATQLQGIFTDGFIGLTKSDIYHSDWSASIDLENQELTLAYTPTIRSLVPDTENNYRAGKFNRLLTAPYREIVLLSQPLVSGSIRVNSYNAFPKTPSVSLNPKVDNWVDTENISISGGITTTTITLRRWQWMNASSKQIWNSYGFSDAWLQANNYDGAGGIASLTNKVSTTVQNTAIAYMRQSRVDISVMNLEPNVDNVVVTFNGTSVSLTPTQSKYQGTTAGTLKADAEGNTYGYFTVPANVQCGTVQVKAFATSNPNLTGIANYTANGTKRTTTQKVWVEQVVLRAYDPIAQAFQLNNDQFVTGVGLYFLNKDINEPITVQIRNMVNGYPGTTVYAEKVISGASIKTSTTAAQETKVVFDDPVYCNAGESYCFTVLSNSDLDSVWLAETTQKDLASGSLITKNPYLNGTLFSSSNALTWTAHQSQDLKFNLYGASFESSGQITFQSVTGVSYDRLMVLSDESIPTGCSITWQYSINGDEWLPLEPGDDRELTEIANTAQVRCNFTATPTVSPAIAADSLSFVGFENFDAGTYISKNINIPNGFNNVKVVTDMYLPTGSNAIISYATDISGTDWKVIENTKTVQKTALYKTYTFEQALTEKAYNYRIKIDMTTVNKINRPHIQNLKNILKTI